MSKHRENDYKRGLPGNLADLFCNPGITFTVLAAVCPVAFRTVACVPPGEATVVVSMLSLTGFGCY